MTGPILVATRSGGKLRELRSLFAEYDVAIVSLAEAGIAEHADEDATEAFETYEENAVAKARYFATRSGLPVVADDSGLEVLALGGRPGVHSKRWSQRPDLIGQALDDANNATLLRAVAGVSDRRAKYVCVAVYCHGDKEVISRGETVGHIVDIASGTGGFGYDPYFYSDELGAPFGAIGLVEKGQVSHRARAFRALLADLKGKD